MPLGMLNGKAAMGTMLSRVMSSDRYFHLLALCFPLPQIHFKDVQSPFLVHPKKNSL
jgi:hypothetical protein